MILRRLFCGRLFYIQKMSQDCCPWSLWCSGFQGKLNHNSIIFTPSVLSTLGAISKPHSFSRSHPILLSPHRASLGGLKWQCFIHSGPNSGSPSHKAFEISEMKLVGFMGLHDNYIQLLMNLRGYCTLYTLLFDMLSSLKTSDPSP